MAEWLDRWTGDLKERSQFQKDSEGKSELQDLQKRRMELLAGFRKARTLFRTIDFALFNNNNNNNHNNNNNEL